MIESFSFGVPVLLFFALVFFGNTVQAVTGFAGTVLIMPFLLPLVGRETAVPVLNFIGLFMCVFMAVKERGDIRWGELLRVLPSLSAGILLGFLLQGWLTSDILRRGFGVFILVCVVTLLIQGRRKRVHIPFAVNQILLLLAGMMHAVFTSGGPLIVVCFMARLPERKEFRATLSAVWVTANSVLAITHFSAGLFTIPFFKLSGFLFPAMVLGTVAGYILYPRVNASVFRTLSFGLLTAAGLYTIFL